MMRSAHLLHQLTKLQATHVVDLVELYMHGCGTLWPTALILCSAKFIIIWYTIKHHQTKTGQTCTLNSLFLRNKNQPSQLFRTEVHERCHQRPGSLCSKSWLLNLQHRCFRNDEFMTWSWMRNPKQMNLLEMHITLGKKRFSINENPWKKQTRCSHVTLLLEVVGWEVGFLNNMRYASDISVTLLWPAIDTSIYITQHEIHGLAIDWHRSDILKPHSRNIELTCNCNLCKHSLTFQSMSSEGPPKAPAENSPAVGAMNIRPKQAFCTKTSWRAWSSEASCSNVSAFSLTLLGFCQLLKQTEIYWNFIVRFLLIYSSWLLF